MRLQSFVLYVLIMLASACIDGKAPPVSAPEVERTAMATLIPSPTETPTSLPTSQPSATLQPTPTPIPSPKAAAMTQLPHTPDGYNTYFSPYWVSFHYPMEWMQVEDEVPGDIVFATESFGLYVGLSANEAAFTVQPDASEIEDPMEALETYWIPNGFPEDAIVIEPAEVTTFNGQPAATALVSHTRGEDTMVVRVAVVAGPDRSAYVTAFTGVETLALYDGIFDVMLNSLTIGREPPGPTIAAGDVPPPPDYTAYENSNLGIGFVFPPEWIVEAGVDGVTLLPPGDVHPGELDIVSISNATDLIEDAGGADATAASVLGRVLWNLNFFKVLTDAILVGEPALATVGDADMARVILAGTVDGEPALVIIHSIKTGGEAVLAISLLSGNAPYRTTVETIMDSIAVSVPVFASAGEVIPVEIGELYEGEWIDGEQIDHSFTVTAGTPIFILFQWVADFQLVDAQVNIYDADGERIQSFPVIRETSDSHLIPEEDGEYKLSFTPHVGEGVYRLVILDARPGAPGIVDVIESEMTARSIVKHEVQGRPGDFFIAVLQDLGQSSRSSLGLALLAPGGTNLAEDYSGLSLRHDRTAGFIMVELPKNGTYTVWVTTSDRPAAYRLVLFKGVTGGSVEGQSTRQQAQYFH